MTIAEFVNHLHNLGIELHFENDRIKCNAPKGCLTPELSGEIKRRKPELLEFFKEASVLSSVSDIPISPVSRDHNLPLSVAQHSLWFTEQLMPGSPIYNLPCVFRLTGPLDCDVLERSLSEIITRHEVLRATFAVENGEPVQIVAPPYRLKLAVVDMSDQEPISDETFFPMLRQDTKVPFDLSKGPLVRIKLIRLRPTEHVLFWMTHHMMWDGWSFDILLNELTALYTAFSKGQTSPLPDMTIQYADYAVWQKEWLTGNNLEKQFEYWHKQLGGERKALQLPLDKPRPAQASRRGGRVRFELSNTLVASLKTLGNEEDATLFMVLLAAFEVILCRYSGQEDFNIGCPMWGRTRPETEKLLGFFTNNVVLRINLEGSPSFRDVIRRVRKTSLDAYTNHVIPFERIVEQWPDANKTSFFQVLFSYQDARTRPLQMGDIHITQLPAPQLDASPFDLLLWFKETQTELMSRLDFNSDIFTQTTMERFANHLCVLLDGVLKNPDTSITVLPLLAESERRQLLYEWNTTETDFARTRGMHELFEQQVVRTPGRTALEYADNRLTYEELDKRSNRLARFLQECGAGPGRIVGISLERSFAMVEGVLAILKCGAAFVPLDPDFPQERLSYMISDAHIRILVTDEAVSGRLPACDARIISLDRDANTIAAYSDAKPEVIGFNPECVAYVIYTSGSTGKPKGVQVPHRAVVNFFTSMGREPGLTQDDIVLAITTLSFDIAMLELFLPLCVGAVSVIVSRETAVSGELLAEMLNRSQATVMQATPATWRMLLAAGWQGSPALKIICGGETFPQNLAKELLPKAACVWNMYGPTETTIWSTSYRLVDAEKPVLIGRPIANTKIYILDKNMQPVPIGVKGEMYIGGKGVALGYLNQPALTEKKFIRDPFSKNAGGMLYKTGDMVKFHPDGNIEFLGRIDNQVKIRGFRIELGEIESVLGASESISQAAVTTIEPKAEDVRLVAYIVPKPDTTFTMTELRKYLRNKLPDYMIPQHFVELDKMPYTPNGKIDRGRLPPPMDVLVETETSFVAPRTHEEKYLAKLWCKLLGKKHVGIYDNFFEIGGYSLLSMIALSRIEKETGVRLNPRMFLTDTLEQIASRCTAPGAAPVQNQTSKNSSTLVQERKQIPQPRSKGGLFQKIHKRLSR
jgi:amino acid adenylation domain-containing protein